MDQDCVEVRPHKQSKHRRCESACPASSENEGIAQALRDMLSGKQGDRERGVKDLFKGKCDHFRSCV